MKLIKAKDYEEMSQRAANIISSQIISKEDSVIGLATGSTVLKLYEELTKRYKRGDLDFSKVRSINLDEYVGLSPDDPKSYSYYMYHNFFKHINIAAEHTYLPDGLADNLREECQQYDKKIQNLGGVDIQLLGVGLNGHIGFNEPNDAFILNTHCVSLYESTIKANSRFFENEEEVPRQAITIGMKGIMHAKHVLLCVNGKKKASILKKILYGPVTPKVPGSILQIHHNLTVIADEEALSEI